MNKSATSIDGDVVIFFFKKHGQKILSMKRGLQFLDLDNVEIWNLRGCLSLKENNSL